MDLRFFAGCTMYVKVAGETSNSKSVFLISNRKKLKKNLLCLSISKCVAMRFSAQKSKAIPSFYNINRKFFKYVSVHRDPSSTNSSVDS